MSFFDTANYQDFKENYFKEYLGNIEVNNPENYSRFKNVIDNFLHDVESEYVKHSLERPGICTYGIIGQFLDKIVQNTRKNPNGLFLEEREIMVKYMRDLIMKYVQDIDFHRIIIEIETCMISGANWQYFITGEDSLRMKETMAQKEKTMRLIEKLF